MKIWKCKLFGHHYKKSYHPADRGGWRCGNCGIPFTYVGRL